MEEPTLQHPGTVFNFHRRDTEVPAVGRSVLGGGFNPTPDVDGSLSVELRSHLRLRRRRVCQVGRSCLRILLRRLLLSHLDARGHGGKNLRENRKMFEVGGKQFLLG